MIESHAEACVTLLAKFYELKSCTLIYIDRFDGFSYNLAKRERDVGMAEVAK